MAEPHVLTSIDGPVARVRLNRPDKLNGVTLDMLRGLLDAATRIRADRDVRVVLIEGEGPSFCSGLDFAEAGKDKARVVRFFLRPPWRSTNTFQQALWAWRELPVPVIAITRGHVYGAGIQLALAADFRFTTPDCQWSVLEAKWGLVPDMSGTVPLTELVPADVAKRLVLTGEVLSGTDAADCGLATDVADDPMKPAQELIDALLERSPDSVAAGKKLLNGVRLGSLARAMRRERLYQLRMFRSPNSAAARKAGITKTPPEFGPRTFG
ncbi:crotonase/enoyl-CoA hydratase family protein [Aeromicrobium sp. CTD01-1L150]|uniref:crotonase/enoyl-CoA hydratase family protein n=1 Tax=Aeromicrobium sp. CTD01-1L150 TaxID=3341830 RepID=UPI0035C07AA8